MPEEKKTAEAAGCGRIVQQHSAVAWQVYDGEAVLVDPAGMVCRVLNATATAVWEACTAPADAARIAADIAGEYDADPEQIRRDVDSIIDDLLARQLLVEVKESV